MKTLEELINLKIVLDNEQLPTAKKTWGGADVIIATRAWETHGYSEPRFVVTPYALEISWLFERLKDAFYAENRLDSCSKIEFFGRLANAANRFISLSQQMSSHDLYQAVLKEANDIYDEMEKGMFSCLPIAFEGEILDDYKSEDNKAN